jgi:hypothetical protein
VDPAVTVVIPTYRRPRLVVRAVESVLAQTLREVEVIVALDGDDHATLLALQAVRGERLRVVVAAEHAGQGATLNLGVRHARAEWVAFLDDDDLWLPAKLERQLAVARASGHPLPVVSCRLIARTPWADHVWPRRFPRPGEHISDYLFSRTTPFSGEGLIQTSTILTRRTLVEAVPFAGQRRMDWDWVLQAAACPGVGFEFDTGPRPLVVWDIDEARPRVTHGANPEHGLQWARERRHLMTGRAFAGLLLGPTSASAARRGQREWFWRLLIEAHRHGTVRPMDVLGHAANFLVPRRAARRAAAAFDRFARAMRPVA